jgi:hypothetical protein
MVWQTVLCRLVVYTKKGIQDEDVSITTFVNIGILHLVLPTG